MQRVTPGLRRQAHQWHSTLSDSEGSRALLVAGTSGMQVLRGDALYLKVREGTRVVSRAALIAYAVNEEGEREVIGVGVAAGEMESCWRGLYRAGSMAFNSSSPMSTTALARRSTAS